MINNDVNLGGVQRLSRAQKEAKKHNWYKDRARQIRGNSFVRGYNIAEVSEYKRMKVNYDLFNNIVNKEDFTYVCKPFGAEVGDLPASFTNKDIISSRVKTLLGMEMKRPFSWKVVATNPEATTRKEEAYFGMIREYVISQIMTPIQQEIELKYQQQAQGQELTQEQQAQIQQQIAQELEAKTPDEVLKYMKRDHQDPAEVMAHQILQYLTQKQSIKRKFNNGWKHLLISGYEIYWVGEENGEPHLAVVNPVRFDYDKSPDVDFIEDGEWACAEYRLTPTQLIGSFGEELSNTEIDTILKTGYMGTALGADVNDPVWSFKEAEDHNNSLISVYHCVWKDLRKVGFLTFISPETGEEEEKIVDETYKLNKPLGDISIRWEWIPEVYETYCLPQNIYVYMRPVVGQFRDLDNLYISKLPYYGAPSDNVNSQVTSLVDRMKVWQYYYNIIMYRLELLMASDKGKILLMNVNSIPRSSGIDLKKWMYYAEAMKIGWVDPSEDGNRGLDVTNMAKEVNMSLISDIQKYVELAGYIEEQCGKSVGITDSMVGQIGSNEAVSNTKQNIQQNSYILEPYFDLHNHVKKNVIEALLNQATISYSDYKGKKLSYFLDDLSMEMVTVDGYLLDLSTYGIFVSNSAKAHEAVELVKQMAHAAMQNQAIDLSDVIKVVRTEGIQEAEEQLEISEEKRRKENQANQIAAIQEEEKGREKAREFEMGKMKFDRETALMIEDKRTERELQKQVMMSMGFNEDKDLDNDGVPDVVELYKEGAKANIEARKQDLDEAKFQHQKEVDKENIKIEKKKASNSGQKG